MFQNILTLVAATLIISFASFYSYEVRTSDLPALDPTLFSASSTTPTVFESETPVTDFALSTSTATGTVPALEDIIAELLETSTSSRQGLFNEFQRRVEVTPAPIFAPRAQNTVPEPTLPSKTYSTSTPPVTTPTKPIAVPPLVKNNEPIKPPAESIDPDVKAAKTAFLQNVIVNIICTPPMGYGLRSTSGSGVVIDSRGIIVTVAHVGQYFLWKDYPTDNSGSCVVRAGNPARDTYTAELIYIPRKWIQKHKGVGFLNAAKGTGEYDFAFLAITGTVGGGNAPASLPFVTMTRRGVTPEKEEEARVGAYAAEFLTSTQIRNNLSPTFVFGNVQEVFSFTGDTIDIFEVNGGIAAQQGSSGGGVLNENNQLLGLITTRSAEDDLSLRALQALAMDHLRRAFENEFGVSLETYIQGTTPSTLVENFETESKNELINILETAIPD